MYYGVNNFYCIWRFALGVFSFEETSEHSSLLLNTSDISLGLSILSYVHLCNFSKFLG